MSEFDDILKRTQSHLRAYIAGLGVSPNDVDDLAQDVYVQFYRNPHARPADVLPEQWLKGIARNLCMNHFRAARRRGDQHRAALLEILARTGDGTERLGQVPELASHLEDCVAQLPERSRRLIALRYVDERPADQIAVAVDMTAEAVRVALHRVRAALRKCLVLKQAEQ